jgi:putative spermidine/putrescine transport system permease protein
MATTTPTTRAGTSPVRRVQSALYRRPGARVAGLLALPMTWMVLVYLTPLALLFVTAFWTTDSFTGLIVRDFSLDNFIEVFTEPAYLKVVLRTVGIAAFVTVLCTVIGMPMAFFMARVASARWQPVLVALVLTPRGARSWPRAGRRTPSWVPAPATACPPWCWC